MLCILLYSTACTNIALLALLQLFPIDPMEIRPEPGLLHPCYSLLSLLSNAVLDYSFFWLNVCVVEGVVGIEWFLENAGWANQNCDWEENSDLINFFLQNIWEIFHCF